MNGTRKISASNLGRLSTSSSRAGRPRRVLLLLLFLVIGMLLLSSITLLMQQPSSSMSITEPSVRLLGLHGTAASNASLSSEPVLSQPATAGRRRRWRLKAPSSTVEQLPHQHTPQQPAEHPSSPAAAAVAAAGGKAHSWPTSLLPELSLSKPHGQLMAPATAQQEPMPAAQPEDVSLILASGQDDERQQPEQQQLVPAAGSPAGLQPGVLSDDGSLG